MNNQMEQIIDRLKASGHKITPTRLKVLSVLLKSPEPISAEAIFNKVKKEVDQVTIYRNLNLLEELGIVTKLGLQNHHSYELSVNHGHYLICQNCNEIEKINTCHLKDIEKESLKLSKNFAQITSHILQMSGLCRKCNH